MIFKFEKIVNWIFNHQELVMTTIQLINTSIDFIDFFNNFLASGIL